MTFYPTKLYCCQICTKNYEDLVDKTALIKSLKELRGRGEIVVFNATFNNISVISIMAVCFIGGVNRENRHPATNFCQSLSHNVVLGKKCFLFADIYKSTTAYKY